MQTLTWEVYVDSVLYGEDTGGFTGITDDIDLEAVWFGALFLDAEVDYDFRNVVVGTTQNGSDIWNAGLASSLVPPFDSVVGDATDYSVAGGIVTVTVPAFPEPDSYAVETLVASYKEIWVGFDIRIRPVTLAGYGPDYLTVADTAYGRLWGLYSDPSGYFAFDVGGGSSTLGSPLSADTWYAVDAHLLLTTDVPPTPTGPVFDGGAAFTPA